MIVIGSLILRNTDGYKKIENTSTDMLDSRRKGYAVMNAELTGIGFVDESFDNCKRYCFNGDVIVDAIPKKCGFSFRVRYHKGCKWFEWSKYDKVLFRCRFYFDWEWYHEYGKDVLYTNPYDYTESRKRGIIS